MVASLLVALMLHENKVIHFELGQADGLTLTADFSVHIDDSVPANQLAFHAHFYARDSRNQIVDVKHVDLGPCFRKPNSFIVADKFRKGYKQVFISLKYGGISS